MVAFSKDAGGGSTHNACPNDLRDASSIELSATRELAETYGCDGCDDANREELWLDGVADRAAEHIGIRVDKMPYPITTRDGYEWLCGYRCVLATGAAVYVLFANRATRARGKPAVLVLIKTYVPELITGISALCRAFTKAMNEKPEKLD